MIQSQLLAQIPSVRHGFTTRHDEVSLALDSLGLGDATLCTVRQVHSGLVVETRQGNPLPPRVSERGGGLGWGVNVESLANPEESPVPADGMWTDALARALLIRTADCLPILLAHESGASIAAIHAGWRGTALGIAVQGVMAMRTKVGSGRIIAAIGPGIGPCCFDVTADVAEQLAASVADAESAIHQAHGRSWVSLAELNRRQLLAAGLEEDAIDLVSPCTKCDDRFFSYRRDPDCGRQGGIIGIVR